MLGLIVVLEEVDAVVLDWQVLQLVPLRSLEALQSLVVPELLAQQLLSRVLHLVLKLKLVLASHLHLHSLGTLLSLVVVALEVFLLPVLLVVLRLVLVLHLLLDFLCRLFFGRELESLDGGEDVFVIVGFCL